MKITVSRVNIDLWLVISLIQLLLDIAHQRTLCFVDQLQPFLKFFEYMYLHLPFQIVLFLSTNSAETFSYTVFSLFWPTVIDTLFLLLPQLSFSDNILGGGDSWRGFIIV